MKETKKIVTGIVLLNLFLLGYGVLITIRLNRLEASHQELQWRYRIFSNTLSHVGMTRELAASLSAAMAQEARGLPAATTRDLRLIGSELNPPPAEVPKR
jgi:hypothetical protein